MAGVTVQTQAPTKIAAKYAIMVMRFLFIFYLSLNVDFYIIKVGPAPPPSRHTRPACLSPAFVLQGTAVVPVPARGGSPGSSTGRK